MDKPATEKWLNRNFVFDGLLRLSGGRQVQRYSRSVIFRSNTYFRWAGGSFLKQDNSFPKNRSSRVISQAQWCWTHIRFFPLPFLTISGISTSTWQLTAAPLLAFEQTVPVLYFNYQRQKMVLATWVSVPTQCPPVSLIHIAPLFPSLWPH